MNQQLTPTVAPALDAAHVPFALPETGEMMLTIRQAAEVLGQSESQTWTDIRATAGFPQPLRRGPRWTRIRASDLRAYIATLGAGKAKVTPIERKQLEASTA